MILLHLLVLIAPSYGWFCEDRWMFFQKNCYKRFEAAPSDYINTCRTFKSVLVENVSANETEFFKMITVGAPMGSAKGDFICKKPAASKEIFTPRTRPHPRRELDCAGDPKWFGLNETKRCYSRRFSHQPLTWEQANTRCKNWYNGTLATMKTELEYNHVINVGHFGTYGLTYEQPLVGYRRDADTWKWVDGTQGGITMFHGGIPDPKLNLDCAQLTTDIAIHPNHLAVHDGVYGRMIPVPCNQRFQRFICSVDQTTFDEQFTPGVPATYCPARWLKHNDLCYRIFQLDIDANYNCSAIGGERFEVPGNSTDELFQKIHQWMELSNPDYPYNVCIQPTSNTPPVYEPTLSVPRNDFDCLVEGWKGLNKTKKCYKSFTDLENHLTIQEMRNACQALGGSLPMAKDYLQENNFLSQLRHLGAAGFYSEEPVLDHDECGGFVISDHLLDEEYLYVGDLLERKCMLGTSYICAVDYEEMERRHG